MHNLRRGVILALLLVTTVGGREMRVPAQPAALRIVVIAGEDAVNIIQQKTAVAPIVEVRDRNDQPVAGALVNFAIRSGRATFGGARTLSVTTNAAGRAVAAGFTPTGSGALQISASAAFQGQSAAAVTIAQTNVLTAAQAAAVSGAGSSGGSSGGASAGAGAGGGGGGLSATTIGILTAAIGGGALVAAKAAGGDATAPESSGTAPGNPGTATQRCTFTVSPASISFPSAPTTVTINVTLDNPGCTGPEWTATTISSFLSISGGSGTGSGSFTASIGGNPTAVRPSGNISVGGRIIEFLQEPSCPFIVNPTSLGTVAATGGTFIFTVTVASPTCNPSWTAFSNQPLFVTVSPTSGTGNGIVTVTVAPAGPLAGPKPLSATIAGQVVGGTQLGS